MEVRQIVCDRPPVISTVIKDGIVKHYVTIQDTKGDYTDIIIEEKYTEPLKCEFYYEWRGEQKCMLMKFQMIIVEFMEKLTEKKFY